MPGKIIDENYYDFIVDNTLGNVDETDSTNDNITYLNEKHLLLHVYKDREELCDLGQNSYSRFPSLFTVNSTVSIEKSGIGQVQRNPFLALYGQGVMVGIIDTGIDYMHKAFLNADGTTRIKYIWDQTIEGGRIPENFTFGTEYTSVQIDQAIESDSPLDEVNTTDINGHGTAVASIIAGSRDMAANFTGVVPEAELVVVKVKRAKRNLYRIFCVPDDKLCFQESDIILAIRYIISKARILQRPVAICLAMGTSQGGHDGLGATSSYISYLAQASKVGIAVAAGNEGNRRRHFYAKVNNNYVEDIELNVGEADKEFAAEVWSYVPARCAIEIVAPTGETTKQVFPSISGCQKFNFIFNNSTVWVNNIIFEEETGDQLMLVRFQNATAGIWIFRVSNLENKPFSIHSWLPAENLISDETFFIKPNPYTTITSPGNARLPLTVTAYNPLNDSFYLESGRGYTRIGIIKPDVAAPGYEIPCAKVGGGYGSMTGTGAAAAHSTGILAMILEWADVKGNYTTITGNDMNRLLIRGAVRKENLTYPNQEWGYGQINVNSFFQNLGLF